MFLGKSILLGSPLHVCGACYQEAEVWTHVGAEYIKYIKSCESMRAAPEKTNTRNLSLFVPFFFFSRLYLAFLFLSSFKNTDGFWTSTCLQTSLIFLSALWSVSDRQDSADVQRHSFVSELQRNTWAVWPCYCSLSSPGTGLFVFRNAGQAQGYI